MINLSWFVQLPTLRSYISVGYLLPVAMRE